MVLLSTQLIKLEDGTLVEVRVPEGQAEQISGGFAKHVDATFEKIKPLIMKTCKPVVEACRELATEVNIEQADVEIGLGFEGEGNLYVTKSTASANLTVKLVLKP